MAIISNGTTIADAGAFSASLGSMVLVKTVTISSSTSSVAMTSAIDDTYPVYKFEFINMHVSTNNTKLQIDFSNMIPIFSMIDVNVHMISNSMIDVNVSRFAHSLTFCKSIL